MSNLKCVHLTFHEHITNKGINKLIDLYNLTHLALHMSESRRYRRVLNFSTRSEIEEYLNNLRWK